MVKKYLFSNSGTQRPQHGQSGRRRAFFALSLIASMGCASLALAQAAAVTVGDPLRFPQDQFTLETATIKTATGEKKVVYRSYQHIPYVAKPVDKNYQSLDVKVPVSIDGKPVKTAQAPILLIVGVGGYMSSPNVRDASIMSMMGPPSGAPGEMGAPAQVGSGNAPPGQFAGAPGTMGGPGGDPNGGVGGFENMGLAEGWVIVNPGVRGRDNKDKDGNYYGKAPAAIVDLKAAVRYVRHNKGILPGNNEQIVSTGCSAGGGLSSLLAASGNSPLYEPYLKEIGAANAADNIFAAGCHSPVMDMDHADLTYEFEFGVSKTNAARTVDATVSSELQQLYKSYQAALKLKGKNNYGTLTADNFGDYMVKYYLAPSAEKYLLGLTEDKRKAYLAKNPWLSWDGKKASFTLNTFAAQHINRFKLAPAFDNFTLSSPENNLFGNRSTDSAHFTNYSLRRATSNPTATVAPELQTVVDMMNPMYFIMQRNPGAAKHWWIRHGAIETDASGVGAVNLATSLENMGRDVNAVLYWDAGHCEDLDPQGFITWVAQVTGYKRPH